MGNTPILRSESLLAQGQDDLEREISCAEYPSHPSGEIVDSGGRKHGSIRSHLHRIPSKRQALAVAYLLGGTTKTESLRNAGYSEAYARSRQKDFFEQPTIKVAIQEGLRLLGITPDSIARAIAEGLEAVTPASHNEDVVARPDYRARHLYLETAARLSRDSS